MIGYRGLIVNIVSLLLSDYIMIAELLGLWIMLGSNVHLKRRTIKTTRVVIILIFTEALLSAIERWTRGLDHLTYARIILTPTVYLLHPIIMLGIMDMAEFVKKHRALLYLPVLISAPASTPEASMRSTGGIIPFAPSIMALTVGTSPPPPMTPPTSAAKMSAYAGGVLRTMSATASANAAKAPQVVNIVSMLRRYYIKKTAMRTTRKIPSGARAPERCRAASLRLPKGRTF